MMYDDFKARLKYVRKSGSGFIARCPAHADKNPSLSVSLDGNEILVMCHAGCQTEAIVGELGLTMRDLFVEPDPAYKRSISRRPEIVDVYRYCDENGELLYETVKRADKTFSRRRPDGKGGHNWNWQGVRRVPYRLPELIAAINAGAKQVYLCEGEKDADNVRSLGLPATNLKDWRPEFNLHVIDREIVIIRDHDKPGVKLADKTAGILLKEINAVRIIDLFDSEPMPDKDGMDVSDWIDARRREGLDNETIAERLEGHADVFDTRRDALDARKEPKGSLRYTEPLVSPSISDICVADLLDEVERFIGRFVSYPSAAARVAHALWIAHTWLMDHWDSTPRLAALSPEPGSGKSRLLEVTEPLVPRAIHAVNTTPAYLFRKVSDPDGPPTILYDEIDTVFGPKAVGNEDIRGMLNAGHRRGAMAGRCVTRGKIIETEELPAYCAVALAGLNDLPDTLMTRSIVIRMRRRAPNEYTEPWRQRRNGAEAKSIAERLRAWARCITSVSFAEPPLGIEDRNADVWEPLLTVAALAGGKWPEKARVAAVALVASAAEHTQSIGVQLLADLRKIFKSERRLGTEAIIQKLFALPESPWCDLRGKPLDARSLRRYLRPYDVKPKQLREGDRNIRGYERSDFDDAWSRYLQAEVPLGWSLKNNATTATSDTTP